MPENQEIVPMLPSKKNRYSTGKIHIAAANINEKYLTVQLPASLAQYLKIKENKVCFHIGNGVIQISGSEPKSVIPMMIEEDFKEQ